MERERERYKTQKKTGTAALRLLLLRWLLLAAAVRPAGGAGGAAALPARGGGQWGGAGGGGGGQGGGGGGGGGGRGGGGGGWWWWGGWWWGKVGERERDRGERVGYVSFFQTAIGCQKGPRPGVAAPPGAPLGGGGVVPGSGQAGGVA